MNRCRKGSKIEHRPTRAPGTGLFHLSDGWRSISAADSQNGAGRLAGREDDGAWKSEYDRVPNPHAFSRASGNTPTLMGFGPDEDKLVIIADAGEEISIVAMWRDEIPGTSPIFNTAGGLFIPLNDDEIFVTAVFGPAKITRTPSWLERVVRLRNSAMVRVVNDRLTDLRQRRVLS